MKIIISTFCTIKDSTSCVGILPVKEHVDDHIRIYKIVFLHQKRFSNSFL